MSSSVADYPQADTAEIREQLIHIRLYDVMQVGFDLYGSDSAHHENEKSDGSAIERFEEQSCVNFMAFCNSQPLNTPEGLYLQRLGQVATSFARSIGSSRRTLLSKRKHATHVRKQAQDREAVVIGWEAMGRLGLQLLIIGGFFGIVSYLVFGKIQSGQAVTSTQVMMSIAVALGSMFYGMSKQLRDISRAQTDIDEQFYLALDYAKEKQCDRMEVALERAALGYSLAYKDYFGESPSDLMVSYGLEMKIIEALRSQNDPMSTQKERLSMMNLVKALIRALRGQSS